MGLSVTTPDGGWPRSSWSTRHHPVLEVRDPRCFDGPNLLEPHVRVPEVVEGARAASEQHRNDVELELVNQSGCQVLPGDLAAAPEYDVLTVGGLPRLLARGLDAQIHLLSLEAVADLKQALRYCVVVH